jgi:hypothetical protein
MSTMRWDEWLKASDESGFSAVPAGEYDLYISTAEAVQSSSGKDMIKMTFVIESGPHEGSKIFSNMVISPESPAALGFLIRKLAALGIDREYLSANPSLEQVASQLENRRCTAKVIVREWNGSDRNDVDALKPPADGVTHHASGPVHDGGLAAFMPAAGTHAAPHSAHHAGKAPELPF